MHSTISAADFDAEGALRDWWTPQSAEAFNEQARLIVDQFSSYEPLPGRFVNGKLTLGENIADIFGLTLALDAYRASAHWDERVDIDGFTPEQRFFLGWRRCAAKSSACRRRCSCLRPTRIRRDRYESTVWCATLTHGTGPSTWRPATRYTWRRRRARQYGETPGAAWCLLPGGMRDRVRKRRRRRGNPGPGASRRGGRLAPDLRHCSGRFRRRPRVSGAYIDEARVVGLGEATHGTREFFRLKHRVFQYLVERAGFRTFAIEAVFEPAIRIDRYIKGGEGDVEALVNGLGSGPGTPRR